MTLPSPWLKVMIIRTSQANAVFISLVLTQLLLQIPTCRGPHQDHTEPSGSICHVTLTTALRGGCYAYSHLAVAAGGGIQRG